MVRIGAQRPVVGAKIAAMSCCIASGVPVLPVHDALIVPASHVKVAERALHGAYSTLGRVMPRLEAHTGAPRPQTEKQ